MQSRSDIKYPFPANWSVSRKRMFDLIKKFYLKNRTVVSEDTNEFAIYIKKIFKGKIIESKPESKILTWKVPKNWNVKNAFISNQKGKKIIDFKNNPLHLWSYSCSYKGWIKKKKLLNHLYFDKNRPDEFCYHYINSFNHNKKSWGFSLPYSTFKKMKDDKYFVNIETKFDNNNSLKVVESEIKGSSKNHILICAHTCHPGLVADGLACIAAASELYKILSKKKLKYSYTFVFGPEYFAAALYLQRNLKNLKKYKYGIFLDMLSTHEPLTLMKTLKGESLIDKAFSNIFRSHLRHYEIGNFKEMYGNDEMFYNGTNINIPMVGFARSKFREYHYNTDNLENCSTYKLEESIWILLRVIDILENNKLVFANFKGPLSRKNFNLNKLKYENSNLNWKDIEKIQALIDGKNTILDIAEYLKLDFYDVENVLKSMNLVTFKKAF